MSTSLFQITEHVIACQHIREYPYAVKSEDQLPKLAIKEYRPLDNLDASPGSVTLIATHANGFVKETYEPLWDDLYKAGSCKIRAIWVADSSHQAASGVLNEDLQGDDPSWFDHSRDLLVMVNRYWERMLRPIIGVGHSLGAAQLVQLSLIHPRLFHGLALIEPAIQHSTPMGPKFAFLTSRQPDWWPSRNAAEMSLKETPFFKAWEPRVLEKYVSYGLRETPTAIYPTMVSGNFIEPSEITPDAVTLTTTKHQEAWSYVRSNFAPRAMNPNDRVDRLISPDVDPNHNVFRRAEAALALQGLPQVRPSILWIFGAQSSINTPPLQDEKMKLSGIGIGGSGGVRAGRVKKEVVEGAGHMLSFERVQECASAIAHWVGEQVDDFNAEQLFYRDYKSGKSEREMLVMSKDWLKGVRQTGRSRRPINEKL